MYKTTNKKVEKVLEAYREIHALGEISGILHWDQNVNMPPQAAANRAYQVTYLQGLLTDKWKDDSFKKLLSSIDEKDLNLTDRAIVRNIKRAAKHYHKVPKKLILEMSRATTEGFSVWQEAKKNNSFKSFSKNLEEIYDLQRETAGYLREKEHDIYDVLLDIYEIGLTVKECDVVFNSLKQSLPTLLKKIQNSKEYTKKNTFLEGSHIYPIDKQKQLSDFVLDQMTYPKTEGRLDISAHPFTTTLGNHDVRITSWFHENDLRPSLYATMHEAGHALYELGSDQRFAQTPLFGGVTLGVHESQSRFWENHVGRSREYVEYLTPVLHKLFPKEISANDTKQLVRYVNQVKPTFVRVEADEVTYNLHIMVRYEIERDLMHKNVAVKDLPEVWREKMREYLGVVPPTDREGVLQDVHWSYGSIGYFPTYTLGNLYAAQLEHTMKKTLKLSALVKKGNLGPIRDWLRKNLHVKGSVYYPKELIKQISGEALNPAYYISYLENKYKDLYDF